MPLQSLDIQPYLSSILSILAIILIGYVAYVLLRRVLNAMVENDYLPQPLQLVFQNAVRWIVLILIVLMCLQQTGIRIVAFWTGLVSVLTLIAVGFIAVWSVLSNILCSVLLVLFDLFRIGDEIEIIEATGGKGLRGRVVNLNVLYTSLQEDDEGIRDGITHVPNNVFFQKTLRRWRGTHTRHLQTSLFRQPSTNDGNPSEPL